MANGSKDMTYPLKPRPSWRRALDSAFFPLRALFMGPQGYFGLSSMKDERMLAVAEVCKGRVLDVGCGPHNLFIRDYIGSQNGVGLDVFAYEGVDFIIDDAEKLPFPDNSFDTLTLIAVGGHIPKNKRVPEFVEFARVIKPGGRIVMTEGEPMTQWMCHGWWHFLHSLVGMKDVDTERGMEEEEEYCMPRQELMSLANTPPLKLAEHRKFMWGLNNVYIIEKTA